MSMEKELYLAPRTEVLAVKVEGVICVSPGPYPEWQEQDI